jgi:very-short-patch-repair endonuclease
MGLTMQGQTSKKILSGKLQRALRHNMTDAEQALWRVLRNRQIDGVKFRRQHPFNDYILDFVCLEIKLVIEVDGGQHGQRTEYDNVRTRELETAGFKVLRFWNNEVLQNIEAVKEKIWMTLQELRENPIPTLALPLKGRGVKSAGSFLNGDGE